MRHLFVVALSAAVLACLVSGASATGPGGWSHFGDAGKAGTSSLNGAVYALNAQDPGVLFVGGAFTSAGGNPNARFIARWNGTTWAPVGSPSLNGPVNAIAYTAGKVFVGGQFTNAGGNTNADFLAVWDGASWKTACNSTKPGPAFGGSVSSLQIIGSTLYVGGSYQNGAGIPAADYILGCDLNTGAPASLVSKDGDVSGGVYALTADSNGVLYAAGQFIDMARNHAADHVASYSGGVWHPLGSGPSQGGGSLDDYARSITAHGTDVYVGTDSLNIGNIAQADHVAKWNGSSWSAMGSAAGGANGWFPASTFIYAMTTSGSRVFVAGSFQNANGNARADHIAVFDGTAWHNVGSDGAGNGPWIGNGLALTTYNGKLVAGGNFTRAGGDNQATSIASYPLVADTTAPRITGYTVSPASFAAAKSAAVHFRLSEAAQVTFSVLKGHAKVRGFSRTGAAGATTFRLPGKGLKRGSYTLSAIAVDAAGNRSTKLARPFKITG